MRALIALAVALKAGQTFAGEQVISVQHDSHRGATCWIINNTGISCLPDSSLLQESAAASLHESLTARASLSNSLNENEHLPAAPPPQLERLRL